MANTVCDVLITEEPLGLPSSLRFTEAGAMVDFWGVVRGTEGNALISGINYEAHRAMAEHQLRATARDAMDRFQIRFLLLHHRIGFVAVAEASLLVRVATAHRAEAFQATLWIVDEIKMRVPIWKHPVFANEGQIDVPNPAAELVRATSAPAE